MRSAFGVDHGDFSKGFQANAARLERAAAQGSSYAAKRIKAGQRGVNAKPGFVGRTAGRLNASSAHRAIPTAKKGGMARMEADAAAKISANQGAAATAAPEAAAKPRLSLKQGLVGGGAIGAGALAGGGGYSAYKNRGR